MNGHKETKEVETMRIRRGLTKTAALALAGGLLISFTGSMAFADAKADYDKTCKPCHGASGKGDGPAAKVLKPPPQDFGTALKGKSDADLTKVIKEGGKAVGKAASMPAYGTKLSDDQIQAIVKYIKELK
jgi:mono/diheme cytochrome c family protein